MLPSLSDLEVGGRHSRTPIIARNITGGLDENTRESTCNRSSAGGRRHGRKCPTVRKPHSPVRTNGRGRQCVQRHPGRGRNTADRNYRPGHDDKKEGCQGSAQEASAQGVRKPL